MTALVLLMDYHFLCWALKEIHSAPSGLKGGSTCFRGLGQRLSETPDMVLDQLDPSLRLPRSLRQTTRFGGISQLAGKKIPLARRAGTAAALKRLPSRPPRGCLLISGSGKCCTVRPELLPRSHGMA